MVPPERTAARVAVLGIVASAVLATAKIGIGLSAHSVATVSDGVESAADVLSSGLVYLGLWIAARPPDAEHPYGHGRFETLTGLAVGVLLAAMGAGISMHALQPDSEETPAVFAVWPLAASIVIKGIMSVVKMRAGRRAGSDALTADAWNDFVDMLSGSVAVAAVMLAVYFPKRLHGADHAGGILIGMIVIFLGFRVVRETAMHLVDTMPEAAQMDELREEALRVPGALAIDKCYARKTGLRYHVDLHLEVNPTLSVMESHEIAGAVRRHLKSQLPWVADVLVHVEPHFAIERQIAAKN